MKRIFSGIIIASSLLSVPTYADTHHFGAKKISGRIRALDTLSIHTYKLSNNDVDAISDNGGKLTDYLARKIAKKYEANPVDSSDIVLGYHYINPKNLYPGVLTFSKPTLVIQRTKTQYDEATQSVYDVNGNYVPINTPDTDTHTMYDYNILLGNDAKRENEKVTVSFTEKVFKKEKQESVNSSTQSGIATPTIRHDHSSITEKNTTTWFYFKYATNSYVIGITPEIVLNKDDVQANKSILDEQYKLHHKESWFGGIVDSLF